jgi:hypothetical protein
MRLLSIVLVALVCVSASASELATKKTQVISEQTFEAANGNYTLKTICIAATDYSQLKAREYCQDDASTINMMSTDRVLMSSSCFPDVSGRCSDYNAFLLQTRMSIF